MAPHDSLRARRAECPASTIAVVNEVDPLLTASCSSIDHRTLRIHERLLPNREVGAEGQGMKKSEATYLFGVSLSSVKHLARAWTLPLSTQGKGDRCVQMTKVVLLYRTNLSPSVVTCPWHVRANSLPKLP
jgi:hypothetical protein